MVKIIEILPISRVPANVDIQQPRLLLPAILHLSAQFKLAVTEHA